jgi:cyclohexanecarboxylate-CoA ligase
MTADDAWVHATLRDWIESWADRAADSSALCTESGSIDFATVQRRTLALAGFFNGLGLRRGDVIAAQLPNTTAFVLAYLAAGYVGATLQTIHMPYRAAEIGPLLAHGRAKAFICLGAMKDFSPAAFAVSLRTTVPSLQHVIAVGGNPPPGALSFPDPDLLQAASLSERPVATDPFQLLYTSGTTSAPKGVPVSYRKFLPNAARSAHELGVDQSSVLLSVAPFTHLYGLFSLNMAFAAGASTALLPAYAPPSLADALDRLRPTALFVAPAHLAACLNEGLLTSERLRSLRFVLISGSACPYELARSVQELMPNGEVQQLWGMSELQAGAFTRPGDDPQVRFTTVGRASPGTELRVTLDNAPALPGTEGELEVRGPSVFDGYLHNTEATAGSFTPDGWFRTGDLARLDAAGNVQLTGRCKDVINRGGVKFNPADIEALIARHPAVASCAIVPSPDAVLGERACCFVVLRAGTASLRLDELQDWLDSHNIAKLKWPERLELIDDMPMTPTRKVMKGELTRRAASKA